MDTLIKDFRRHYFKVRDVCSALSTTGTFGLKISGTGKEMYAHCETPNEEDTACFAVVMRRFLNPADSIYYKEIWRALQIRFGTEISDNEFQRIEILREQLDSGYAQMKFDGKNLTPAEIYQTISDAGYFDSQEEARLHFQTISMSPAIKQLLLYQFYDYMLSGFALVSSLFTVASRFERVRRLGEKAKVNRCIYCLTSDGSFSAEEHNLSEALGSYDTVLARGASATHVTMATYLFLITRLLVLNRSLGQECGLCRTTKRGNSPKPTFRISRSRKLVRA